MFPRPLKWLYQLLSFPFFLLLILKINLRIVDLSLSLSMWIVHVCVFVFVFEFGMQIVDTCLKSDMILNVEFRWAILEIT